MERQGGAWSAKPERRYEHIKKGLRERGETEDVAQEIAGRTVKEERARNGESKDAVRSSTETFLQVGEL